MFHRATLGDKANQSESECLSGVYEVDLYVQDAITVHHVGLANVFKNLTDDLRRVFHNHTLPSNTQQNQVVIATVDIIPGRRNVKYPYTFKTNNEVTAMLAEIYRAAIYSWDSRERVRPVPTIQPNRRRRRQLVERRRTVLLVEMMMERLVLMEAKTARVGRVVLPRTGRVAF